METLEAIDRHLSEHARDLTEQYTSKFGEEAILLELDQEPQQHLYVDPVEWEHIQDELDLADALADAARAAHNREYERIATETSWYDPVDRLATKDVLVMMQPIMQDLQEAGLSNRQAFIQTLRMQGDTHEEMATKLSISTGSVKTHCDRIDRKLRRAETLLDIVDPDGGPRSARSDLQSVDREALTEAIQHVTLAEEIGAEEFGAVPQWVTTARKSLETARELTAN